MASKILHAAVDMSGPAHHKNDEHIKSFLKGVDDWRDPCDSIHSDLAKMKRVVREIFVREEALVTKARILQVLAAGAGEEVKLVSNVLDQVKLGKQRVEEKQVLQENTINLLLQERDDLQSTESKLRHELNSQMNTITSVTKERDDLLSSLSMLRSEMRMQENAIKTLNVDRIELLSSARALRDQASSRENFINEVLKERDEALSVGKKLQLELRMQEEVTFAITRERDEQIAAASKLQTDLSSLTLLHEERKRRYEAQRQEKEKEFQETLGILQCQLEDSMGRFRTFEAGSTSRLRDLEQKEALYTKWFHQLTTATRDLRASSEISKGLVLGLQHEFEGRIKQLTVEMEVLGKQAEGYQSLFSENRKLYNDVLDLRGNIRVYCRVRPSSHGIECGTVDFIGSNGDIMIINPSKPGKDSRRIFNFHKVFGSTATQQDVYMETRPLIRSVLDGYNVCIFAYGQTGSGKTYTMSGPNKNVLDSDIGVNYRALTDLFMIIENRKEVFQYEIGVQMVEIYNEQVRDLLSAPGSMMKKLEIKNHNSQLNVPDASFMSVISKDDVLELMRVGGRNRAVGATAINERSSRSHSVLTVHVQGVDLTTGTHLRGSLHLVDLAGSERIEKSEVTGERLKEALHINKSLSALGDVIAALAQKSAHIPYRNSKLTQLLQDSLGGQGKALMVVHITADVDSFGETISTLKFAERVATVELGAARSNREPGEIRELKEQIANLKETIVEKDVEMERLRMSCTEDGIASTPTKTKKIVGSSIGLASRRSSKDNVLGRKMKPSPEGGFGSSNMRFV